MARLRPAGMQRRVLTLCRMRLRLALSHLRSASGVSDTVTAVVMGFVGLVIMVAMSSALGILAALVCRLGDPDATRVVLFAALYSCGFCAAIPLVRGGGGPSLEVDRLRIYPMPAGELYAISVLSSVASGYHLVYLPGLAVIWAVLLVNGIRGVAAALAAGSLVLLAIALVVWSHTLVLVLQAVLRGRRLRELLALVGVLVVIVASLMVPAVQKLSDAVGPGGLEGARAALGPLRWTLAALPPGLAASSLAEAVARHPAAMLPHLLGLVLWTGLGAAVGWRVLRRSLLEPAVGGGQASAGTGPTRGRALTSRLVGLLPVPPVVRAVAVKELTTQLRSTLGRLNLVVAPLLPALAALVFAPDISSPLPGLDAEAMVFIGGLVYMTLLSNNLLVNAFMWEGSGILSYYLGPAPLQQVLVGKNLAVWLGNVVVFGIFCLTWTLCAGWPGTLTVLTGGLAFAVSLLLLTLVGTLLSILFPVRRDASSMFCPPSQTAMLLSFVTIAVGAALIGGVLVIAIATGRAALQPALLAGVLVVEALVYRLVLGLLARLMARRREAMIEALAGEV